MEWLDMFETGDIRIDEQHKLLIKMQNEYASALREGNGKWTYSLFLDFLGRYERTHFILEESWLVERHCPVEERFTELRTAFRDIIADYHGRFSVKGFDVSDARELSRSVEDWLSSHLTAVVTNARVGGLRP